MIQIPQSTQRRGFAMNLPGFDITRQGDVGWGVANREPRFSVFKKVWEKDADGVRRSHWVIKEVRDVRVDA